MREIGGSGRFQTHTFILFHLQHERCEQIASPTSWICPHTERDVVETVWCKFRLLMWHMVFNKMHFKKQKNVSTLNFLLFFSPQEYYRRSLRQVHDQTCQNSWKLFSTRVSLNVFHVLATKNKFYQCDHHMFVLLQHIRSSVGCFQELNRETGRMSHGFSEETAGAHQRSSEVHWRAGQSTQEGEESQQKHEFMITVIYSKLKPHW